MSAFRFLCSCCGEWHEGLPDLAFQAPWYWNKEAAAADPAAYQLDSDFCVIGGDRFIRCTLAIPLMGHESRLGWGVWVSQSPDNFELYKKSFDVPIERVTFGYLANRLPVYADTLNLRVQTHWTADGKRPWVELEPSDHPLYVDWRNGISRDRAIEFAELVLHPTSQ